MKKENVGDFALKERMYVNQKFGNFDLKEVIFDVMDLSDGPSVLDVACGDGHFTLQFKQMAGDGFVAGIDQSKHLINKAKKAAKSSGLNIEYKVADALKLPY